MRQLFLLVGLLVLLFSCRKNEDQKQIVGQWMWVIQYTNNPAFNSTPQSTGIQETLLFSPNGTYTVTQNNVIVNTGAYKTTSAKSSYGVRIPGLLYSNSRVTDSVAYYALSNNNDSLSFSNDLIGTVGSGSRHYGRK